jgi:penicillin-binding protein-related factor A (putative recombinase)
VFIGVEIKAALDQLRHDQRTFLNELKRAGGLAFIAYSFAQLQKSFFESTVCVNYTANDRGTN